MHGKQNIKKSSSDCQKTCRIVRKSKAHYPIYDSQPLLYYHPIYAQVFNISLCHQFPHQNTVCIYPCQTCYMNRPWHSSWFDKSSNTWRKLPMKKLLIFPLSCYLVPLRLKYLPQHRILEHPQSTFLPQCEKPSFTEHKTTEKLQIFIFW